VLPGTAGRTTRVAGAPSVGRWAEQRLHLVDSPADAAALFAR